MDEAGRGPLAGPVVVAAVLLPEDAPISGLQDSKKLTREQRERLEVQIRERAAFHVIHVSPEEIDRRNILRATLWGMERALEELPPGYRGALIDGNHVPDQPPVLCSPVIKGDATYAAIAAASILAKNERDRLMIELAAEFPGYGFERNFGYPTPEHLAALRRLGPCPIHRRSFEPVRSLALQGCLLLAD